MQRALVLGTGFAGSHIIEHFNSKGIDTTGLSQAECDLTDPTQVRQISFGDYDFVLNTAGRAANNPNEPDPEGVMHTNIYAQLNVAEEIARQGKPTRLLAIGSAAIFDMKSQPVSELSPLRPEESRTAYIASKIAMRAALLPLQDTVNLNIAHPMNHTGARQLEGFVIPDWAKKIWEAEDPLQLDTSRLAGWINLTDVRAMADAYLQILLKPYDQPSSVEYVIGSAHPLGLHEAVQHLAFFLGKRITVPPLMTEAERANKPITKGSFERDIHWTGRNSGILAIRSFAEWFLLQQQATR